ncbi:hypothetical protein [Paenibacillus dokdonensis]|uniref:hypothetical protein n=1 Tax=Paenibacillus dokdonensis TaxID=2567944 RepID=UPI001FECA107|nr:hypothetical protein [Paenibacillus dokdonensis]
MTVRVIPSNQPDRQLETDEQGLLIIFESNLGELTLFFSGRARRNPSFISRRWTSLDAGPSSWDAERGLVDACFY